MHIPDYSLLSVALDGSVVKLDLSSNYDSRGSEQLSDTRKYPSMIWKQNVKDPVFSTPIITSLNSAMVIAIVINVKGCVVIFNYDNQGQVLWTHNVKANIFSSPILLPSNEDGPNQKAIIFGGHNKILYKLALSTGEHMTHNSNAVPQVQQIENSNIDGHVLQCNFQWQVMLEDTIFSTPTAFVGGSQCNCSICINNHDVNVINPSYETAKAKYDDGIIRIASECQNPLFIASVTTDGLLNIICAKSGERLKSYKVGHNIFSSPVIVNDYIVIGNRDNLLTCFQLKKKN